MTAIEREKTTDENDKLSSLLEELSARQRRILGLVVEDYGRTGEPVGSQTLSLQAQEALSSATIRHEMAILKRLGILWAPHKSAGCLPTALGLRLFVHGLLKVGKLTARERRCIEDCCRLVDADPAAKINEAVTLLSGLSGCAGLMTAPRVREKIKHIEFVAFGRGQALVILVGENGVVENKVIEIPPGLPPERLAEAGNYLLSRVRGRSLEQAARIVREEAEIDCGQLDRLSQKVVKAGLATWQADKEEGVLIVRGQSKLLNDVNALADLERVRALLETLETQAALLSLLDLIERARGVQIFVGSESTALNLTGCSLVIAPYCDKQGGIIGALGVIGPLRIDYARIIPMVDYTAQAVGQLWAAHDAHVAVDGR